MIKAKRKTPDGANQNLPKSGVAFCGDCLLVIGKKAKKMASPTGVDGGRSPTCASKASAAPARSMREYRRPQGEKRRATPIKVSNPIFCKQKTNSKKTKNGISNGSRRRAKPNVREQSERNPSAK